MRQSALFTKTRREAPKDEVAKNAELLIRAGFVHKEMAGVYSFLPLGLSTLNKIVGIIRAEMNAIGGQEIFLSTLQDKAVWEKSGRWSDAEVDSWFKTKFKNSGEAGLAFTHEEPITRLMREHVRSFRDLPVFPYQFQVKFRNETRAKSGILRGREFLMKDLYSFSRSKEDHDQFYEKIKEAYRKIFNRVGLGEKTVLTFASGGSFSAYSHEFQTLTDAGEDTIHLCKNCRVAVNEEIVAEQSTCPACGGMALSKHGAVEVGNIFSLGTRFSEAFGFTFLDEAGKPKYPVMGSYGIGPSRLLGTIAEVHADGKGLVWPVSVAPFAVHVVALPDQNGIVVREAGELVEVLERQHFEILFDDRDARAGEKFADADLIGIPLRVVVSEKTLAAGTFEVSERSTGKVSFLTEAELIKLVIRTATP